MSESDLKFIFVLAIVAVLWGAFIVLFGGSTLSGTPLDKPEKETTGIFSTIIQSTNFLNPFSDSFNSDVAIISYFIFSILLFGVVVIGLRFIRGV